MTVIVRDCFGNIEQIHTQVGNRYRALRLAQKIVMELITQDKSNMEDGIWAMSWKRVLGGYNIYDNFGSGICYKVRINF